MFKWGYNQFMNKDEFIKYVESSKLSDEDKDSWRLLFGMMDDRNFGILIDFVEGKDENLRVINENIKAKKQAFLSKNESDWNRIYNEEKQFLTKDNE